MLPKIIFATSSVALIALFVLLNSTTPTSAGPVGVLVFFGLLYLGILGLVTFFMYGANKVISFISSSMITRKPFHKLSFGRAYYYSTVLSLAPIILIAQQSMGNIGFFEIILVIMFEIVACIYVSKR